MIQSISPVSVSVSAQDGIVALGKAHTCSTLSLSNLPKVALETVPIFAWLNTNRSQPWRVECWPNICLVEHRSLSTFEGGMSAQYLPGWTQIALNLWGWNVGPVFAWLNTDRSQSLRVECRPLPFFTPLSSRWSMLWCSGPSMFTKLLKPRSTFTQPQYFTRCNKANFTSVFHQI